MTPDLLTGAWRRTSIAVDGGPPTEPAEVVWVQAGASYADLRVPKDPEGGPVAFGGTTTWREPHLRWIHELDLAPDGADDVGALAFDGDDLVERGSYELDGRSVPYEERWRRVEGGGGAALAVRRGDGLGLLVQAGDHAATIVDDRGRGGELSACYRVRDADGWSAVLSIGGGAIGAPGPDAIAAGDALPAGRTGEPVADRGWHVVHRHAPDLASHPDPGPHPDPDPDPDLHPRGAPDQ